MAIVSFSTKFDLTTTPKKFVFVDTSNYAGQGIALNTVFGSFKITSPSGIVIYDNTLNILAGTCDININASLTNQTTISLPVNGSGIVEAGLYTILYSVYSTSTLQTSLKTNTYTYVYVAPTVAITVVANCNTPSFVSTDSTNYVISGVTPTITRVHVLNYPYSTGTTPVASPITVSTQTLSTGIFYNGTQTISVVSNLTYIFPDGLTVVANVSGEIEKDVNCTSMCAIYCCVRTLYNTMISNRTSNYLQYQKDAANFTLVKAIQLQAEDAQNCSKYDDVAGYLAEVMNLANCTSDCSCNDGTPTQVVGLGSQITLTPQHINYSFATSSGLGIVNSAAITTPAVQIAGAIFDGTNYYGKAVLTYEVFYSLVSGTCDIEIADFTGTVYASFTLPAGTNVVQTLNIVATASTTRNRLAVQIKNKAAVAFTLNAFNILF